MLKNDKSSAWYHDLAFDLTLQTAIRHLLGGEIDCQHLPAVDAGCYPFMDQSFFRVESCSFPAIFVARESFWSCCVCRRDNGHASGGTKLYFRALEDHILDEATCTYRSIVIPSALTKCTHLEDKSGTLGLLVTTVGNYCQ